MRSKFPIFSHHPDWVYLDTAATAQKPKCVIDAICRFYKEEYATVHRSIYRQSARASELYHESRRIAAEFIGADRDQIVFTKGTTEAINLIAQSFAKPRLSPKDEILISEMEHHSNFVPWQMLEKETGATLKFIPVNEKGELLWKGMITKNTKIISLAHMSNVTGTIHPIREIAKEAHSVGATFVVDGAQAAAHLEIDVKELGCDFYAFSAHKCYGPTGVGVLFGKEELLEQMAPIQGGGDMIAWVEKEETTYQSPPLRFEAGTPNIAGIIALKPALEFLKEHRKKEDSSLLEYATQKLLQIPNLHILGTAAKKGPILTFHIDGIHPLDIATFLDIENIAIRSGHLCAQPLLTRFHLGAVARASFGLYNTKEDIVRLEKALYKLVEQHSFV